MKAEVYFQEIITSNDRVSYDVFSRDIIQYGHFIRLGFRMRQPQLHHLIQRQREVWF